MRKIMANIIGGFIPFKRSRTKVRNIVAYGLINYTRLIRQEPKLKFKHYLSICAIVKNEGPYIKEWIEFHKLVGVEKFYIYDNESTDNIREILKPYITANIVEYTYWPGDKQQIPAYQDCVDKHKNDTKWLAFIDIDEFITTKNGTIVNFLKSLPPSVSQLLIGWMIYGSSGHKTKPNGLVIENYKRRGPDNALLKHKPITNPRMCISASLHENNCFRKTVDENCAEFMDRDHIRESCLPKNKIRINHYACKSLEEFLLKKERGDAYFGHGGKYTKAQFERLDRNEILDPIMDKYIDPVKKAMKNK